MKLRFSAPLTACSIVAIAMAGWLQGCVSAPTPGNATTSWNPPAEAQQTDAVWTTVRAQTPDLSRPLALAELMDLALANNAATRKAWSEARVAAEQVSHAQGYFMPAVVATAGGARQGVAADSDQFNQKTLKYGPGLQVNYLIINFGGGRGAAVEQALQTVYATDFAFNQAIQEALLAVETAYYGLISAQAGVAAAEAGVKDAKSALDIAQESKAAGTGTELDVLQAQALYDQSAYQLASAAGLVKIAQGGLAQAIGVPADANPMVLAPTNDLPELVGAPDMQYLVDEAMNRRPDIAALRATLAAQQAAVKVAGAALWPSLYFTGGLSRDYYSYNYYNGLTNQDRDWSYAAGLSLSWTLFDGYQTLSSKRAAQAQAEAAEAQLKQAELAASADVWMRYHTYETAIQKHKYSAAFLKSALAAQDLALDSYKAGLKSILDLLNAESQLAQARAQSVSARQEVFTALANLVYSAGRLPRDGAAQDIFATPTRKDPQP